MMWTRRQQTMKRKAAGLCTQCGGDKEGSTKATCRRCRAKAAERYANEKLVTAKRKRERNGEYNYDPTPEEIAQMIADIQAGWDTKTRSRRAADTKNYISRIVAGVANGLGGTDI